MHIGYRTMNTISSLGLMLAFCLTLFADSSASLAYPIVDNQILRAQIMLRDLQLNDHKHELFPVYYKHIDRRNLDRFPARGRSMYASSDYGPN